MNFNIIAVIRFYSLTLGFHDCAFLQEPLSCLVGW